MTAVCHQDTILFVVFPENTELEFAALRTCGLGRVDFEPYSRWGRQSLQNDGVLGR